MFGLLALLRPAEAVVCAAGAHIDVDETGAGERILGAKLIRWRRRAGPSAGKLVPEQLAELGWMFGSEHHVQPAVVSITQSTELGTVYTPDEVAALRRRRPRAWGCACTWTAPASPTPPPRSGRAAAVLRACTVDAGVDVISFGGTKNGLLGGEAVVFLDEALAVRARYLRKSVGQLPSKMRFVAAQFIALLGDDLWLRNAAHANAMAGRLFAAVHGLTGVDVAPPAVNSLFPVLPRPAIAALQAWSFFWEWDRRPRPGALDDVVGHHRRRPRAVRRRRDVCHGRAGLGRLTKSDATPYAGSAGAGEGGPGRWQRARHSCGR